MRSRRPIHENCAAHETKVAANGKQDSRYMTTKLEGPLRRALTIGGNPYVLTITPDGLMLVPKGRRKGYSLAWDAFVSGEAALATALNASLMVTPTKSSAVERRMPGKALTKVRVQRKPGRSRRR
jgi:hypothetical protein